MGSSDFTFVCFGFVAVGVDAALSILGASLGSFECLTTEQTLKIQAYLCPPITHLRHPDHLESAMCSSSYFEL